MTGQEAVRAFSVWLFTARLDIYALPPIVQRAHNGGGMVGSVSTRVENALDFQGIAINVGDTHLAFEMWVCKTSYLVKLAPSSSELTTGP